MVHPLEKTESKRQHKVPSQNNIYILIPQPRIHTLLLFAKMTDERACFMGQPRHFNLLLNKPGL